MKRTALVFLMFLMFPMFPMLTMSLAGVAHAQTRIDPPTPAPTVGRGNRTTAPVLFPLVMPRAPISRADLVGPPAVLWGLAWTDGLMLDRFRGGGSFRGFGRSNWSSRRGFGGGYFGGSQLSGIGWTPYGWYGDPNEATAPSNPYGTYAPWTPSAGNPYGPYAAGRPQDPSPPE